MTVLLIDDDIDDTMLFKKVLSDINPQVLFLSAGDGREAMDYLLKPDSRKPDLIFLDLNMPKMNGKEFLNLLKKDAKLSAIPVMIYTTSSLPKDREETMKGGAVCFITKPSSIVDLKQILIAIAGNESVDVTEAVKRLSMSGSNYVVC